MKKAEQEKSGVTLRAIIAGLILLVLNAWWIVIATEVWYSLRITAISLFFNAVYTLFLAVILNLLLRKFLPRFAFSQGELLTVYVILVTLATACGHASMTSLLSTLAHPFWFATAENEWSKLFHQYIPEWLTVRNKDVLSGFFEGESTLYLSENFRAWIPTVLLWSGIVFVLYFMSICVNVILRKQWVEEEKLSYPIVRLPVAMTGTGFFNNKLMWTGFAIAGVIDLINGIHVLHPAMPYIPINRQEVGHFFTQKPWSALSGTYISFYPFIIGLTFFVPLDISFSTWTIFLFTKAQLILGSAAGLRSMPGFPYLREQSSGAWMGFGLLALWASKKHLKRVIQNVFRISSNSNIDPDDSKEPMSYRKAVLGIIIAAFLLTVIWHRAGMQVWVALLFLVIYFALALAITRVRAEVGTPDHELYTIDPREIIVTMLGTRTLGRGNLTMLSFLYPFNRCNRAHPAPNQLEAFKIADMTNMETKRLLWIQILAIIVGVIVSFWVYLHIMYEYGASVKISGATAGIGRESFGRLASWLHYPKDTDRIGAIFMGFGALFTAFCMFMRRISWWWPFHPAGYALGTTPMAGMNYIWFTVFLSWLIKWVILKQAGLKAYRKAVPFFLGLILGEYVIGSTWCIIGIIWNVQVHSVWP